MKYFLLLVFTTIFIGCASTQKEKNIELVKKDTNLTIKQTHIYDLLNIPQNPSYYLNGRNTLDSFYEIQNRYEKYYFNIWNIEIPPDNIETVTWPFFSYKYGNSYGENFQLLRESFFEDMYNDANFDNFSSVNKRALTLKETNIRAFPTIKPLLRDPSLAGEGFPFDYLQNSTVHANKPIFISHYSKDKKWAYAFTSFTSGWIKSDEFVYMGIKESELCKAAKQIKITKEGVPIYDEYGTFMFYSKIGMMFSLISEDDKQFTVLTVSSSANSQPLYRKSTISKSVATDKTLKLNNDNLSTIIHEVMKTNYGWGGIYGQRDCSSMLRDLFSPFGIWLPRNSYQQSKRGLVISLEGMSSEEKIQTIKDKAIPFETLLYKKGHIVLYVGTFEEDIVVFHNVWGIKTKKDSVEGRVVIGKPIFSTLKLGRFQKNYDEEAEILKNLKSMNILTQ
ncbi:SH3 domain-containing protein [Sulfurimonas sp.]|nr:SH3 domain-containing protein [Sulfurimonas sp.]